MAVPEGARVAGPGELSVRTDLGGQPIRHMADPRYGEDKAFVAQQKAAPLAQAPGAPRGPAPSELRMGGPDGYAEPQLASPADIVPFGAASSRPGEPVTAGVPIGPGPGPMRSELRPGQLTEALSAYLAADDTGILQDFAWSLAEMGL